MELYIILGIVVGIAFAGYFIGDGLKNFKNPTAPNAFDFLEDEEEEIFLNQKEVHHFFGISKEDVGALLQKHPEIPHIELNGNTYYPKEELREWAKRLNRKDAL